MNQERPPLSIRDDTGYWERHLTRDMEIAERWLRADGAVSGVIGLHNEAGCTIIGPASLGEVPPELRDEQNMSRFIYQFVSLYALAHDCFGLNVVGQAMARSGGSEEVVMASVIWRDSRERKSVRVLVRAVERDAKGKFVRLVDPPLPPSEYEDEEMARCIPDATPSVHIQATARGILEARGMHFDLPKPSIH